MGSPVAYGIDFGTTNSSIAISYPDHVQVVDVSEHEIPALSPSVVYLHRNGGRGAGEEAIQQYLVTGAHRTRCSGCSLVERRRREVYTDCRQFSREPGAFCQDARIVAELKSELASDLFESTHSWAKDFDLPDLVAVIFRALKRAADQVSGSNVRRAVIGFPVVFAGAEGPVFQKRQELALKRLTEAAARAGLNEVHLLEEPAAVVVDERLDRGLVVVVDFGGGTFDVAVVELEPEKGVVLALQGAAVGGERFTEALFDFKVAPSLGIDRAFENVPAWLRQSMRSVSEVMHLLSNPQVPGILRSAQSGQSARAARIVEDILFGGHAYSFHKAIEKAKIDLSERESTSIEFHRPGIDISIAVTRGEFEAMIARDLEIIRNQIQAALSQASVSPSHVLAVLRTGGSSGIPAFLKMLEGVFGGSRIQVRAPFTAIVHGLAAHARNLWAP